MKQKAVVTSKEAQEANVDKVNFGTNLIQLPYSVGIESVYNRPNVNVAVILNSDSSFSYIQDFKRY